MEAMRTHVLGHFSFEYFYTNTDVYLLISWCVVSSIGSNLSSVLSPVYFTMASLIESMKSIPTHMDYDGQARAEKLSRIIVTLFGVVGLIWGYAIQEFSQALYILGAGCVMAAIITVPPWPMYRRKPLDWQKPQNEVPSKNRKKK